MIIDISKLLKFFKLPEFLKFPKFFALIVICTMMLPILTSCSSNKFYAPNLADTNTAASQQNIRTHGAKLPFANMSLSNYPDYIQPNGPAITIALLTDGIANDNNKCFTCNEDKPEFDFDLGSVQKIQSFAIGGYNNTNQSLLFKIFISTDLKTWTELGKDVDLKIAQPIIADPSIYIEENFDNAAYTGRMNPAPTEFDTNVDELFNTGNFQSRTQLDVNGAEIDVETFLTPKMDITIVGTDWKGYGFVNQFCNYMFHYFMNYAQSARYIRIVGYGNTSSSYYSYSSLTEVQVFGVDTN